MKQHPARTRLLKGIWETALIALIIFSSFHVGYNWDEIKDVLETPFSEKPLLPDETLLSDETYMIDGISFYMIDKCMVGGSDCLAKTDGFDNVYIEKGLSRRTMEMACNHEMCHIYYEGPDEEEICSSMNYMLDFPVCDRFMEMVR